MAEHLQALATAFAELPSFDLSATEAALRGVAAARGVKAASLIHAVRVALTGRTASPGLFEVAALLGRDRVLRRLGAACALAAAANTG
jgi:glutamyl-tRNA synthetase